MIYKKFLVREKLQTHKYGFKKLDGNNCCYRHSAIALDIVFITNHFCEGFVQNLMIK